jgi:hypothetical protein
MGEKLILPRLAIASRVLFAEEEVDLFIKTEVKALTGQRIPELGVKHF